jgi:PPOX class probable F420-dependent enzyme
LNEARIGHLATSTRNGKAAVVPICYVYSHGLIYTPIDKKPKKAAPTKLRRVRNIRENPQVGFIVDKYSEDWGRLGYVVLFGRATMRTSELEHRSAVALLRKKYHQYKTMRLEERPIIKIKPFRAAVWKPV